MHTDKRSDDNAGKKIFILYPHSVIEEKMLDTLIMNGFETYTLRDYKKAFRALQKFPDSIMLINIDEKLPEKDWETYINRMQKDAKTKNCRIGVLSYNYDHELEKKYDEEINVPCGYIHLKLSLRESTEIIINALDANDARGRRRNIRAFCESGILAMLNFQVDNKVFRGKILDISVAGLAVRIEGLPELAPHIRIPDVQLKLHSSLFTTDLILVGKRNDDTSVYIMLFDPSKLDDQAGQAINHFIIENLQHYIEKITQ